MTFEYTEPPVPVLRALLARASYLLLDFDGPLCRLFAHNPAARIADGMRDYLAAREAALLDRELRTCRDPHRILVADLPGHLTAGLERLLADEEEVAALSAEPTPGAEEFARLAAERGHTLAVASNNAPRAVETYLKTQGMDGLFGDRVFGRSTDDPRLMKPHPDCLVRALAALGADPADCLMIGDSPADAHAAHAAGVPFLGYARSPERVPRLREAARPHEEVVVGMAGLQAALREAA